MQVKCRCGQEFTTYEPHITHRINCHMCGVKFMVLEDGTTEEIRAITVNANCRCGRAYTINALQFPRNVLCVDCNHRFSVLDSGEIIDDDLELESAACRDSTAIQANGPSESKTSADTAIQKEQPGESRFMQGSENGRHEDAAPPNFDPPDERFVRQLTRFDDCWRRHRLTYLVAFFHWFHFYPTRWMCVGAFAAFVPTSVLAGGIFFAIFDVSPSAAWWILLISANASIYLFAHFFQRAALHDAAEKRWQTQRDAMIREHRKRQARQTETNPTDSDGTAC